MFFFFLNDQFFAGVDPDECGYGLVRDASYPASRWFCVATQRASQTSIFLQYDCTGTTYCGERGSCHIFQNFGRLFEELLFPFVHSFLQYYLWQCMVVPLSVCMRFLKVCKNEYWKLGNNECTSNLLRNSIAESQGFYYLTVMI